MIKHGLLKITAIFFFTFFAAALTAISANAMTYSEIDEYNNLYYPQSVYNGGMNITGDNTQSAYVNPADGSVQINTVDLSLKGAGGFDLNIARTYNSQNSALFESYLKEVYQTETHTYYTIRGYKETYKYYTNGEQETVTDENICLSPIFMLYTDNKTPSKMLELASEYEFKYTENIPKNKLFLTLAEAQTAVKYINSTRYEIQAVYPFSGIGQCNVDYYNFEIVPVNTEETSTKYTEGLLDDTACERYSRLGAGWEFDFPYIETRYGYDDEYEYLHFGGKGTYLVSMNSDGGDNHLAGYKLNDIVLE